MAIPPVNPNGNYSLRGRTFNTMARAINQLEGMQNQFSSQAPGFSVAPGYVWAKNNSGADVGRFGVLGVDNPIIDPDDNEGEFLARVQLDCSEPDKDAHRGRFVVLQEPAADGAIARAVISGPTIVKVNCAHGYHQRADIADGEDGYLQPSTSGAARVLWLNGTSGEQWAVVNLNSPLEYFAAEITGSASLATNRWKYAWTEKEFDGDGLATLTGGRSGTTSTDYAVNIAETNHTSTYAWGVDTTGDDYPDGFVPQPVGGAGTSAAHAYNVPVWMREEIDLNGNRRFYFYAIGGHDGTCDAE